VEATTAGIKEATTQVFSPVISEKVPRASFFFLEPTPSTRMEQAAVVLEFFFPAISNPPGSNQDGAWNNKKNNKTSDPSSMDPDLYFQIAFLSMVDFCCWM
jgi:hypothetical protein